MLRQHLLWVEQGVAAPQGVIGRQGQAPIQHFLPIGLAAAGGRLHQQAGVARLAAAAGCHAALLARRGEGEEFSQQAIGRVQQVGREIAAGVHKARFQAAPHPIHHRGLGLVAAPLKGQQINVANRLTHQTSLGV